MKRTHDQIDEIDASVRSRDSDLEDYTSESSDLEEYGSGLGNGGELDYESELDYGSDSSGQGRPKEKKPRLAFTLIGTQVTFQAAEEARNHHNTFNYSYCGYYDSVGSVKTRDDTLTMGFREHQLLEGGVHTEGKVIKGSSHGIAKVFKAETDAHIKLGWYPVQILSFLSEKYGHDDNLYAPLPTPKQIENRKQRIKKTYAVTL